CRAGVARRRSRPGPGRAGLGRARRSDRIRLDELHGRRLDREGRRRNAKRAVVRRAPVGAVMAKIIEARAVISGEEKLSPLLDKLAKKFDAVQKTAKGTEGVDSMAASLSKVKKEMEAIDRYSSSGSSFARARENFRNATRQVEDAAAAMKRGEGNAKELARAYEMAQRNVRAASRAFEAQKSAAIADKRALDELGISGGRIVETQNRIAAAVDKATVAMERQQTQSTRLQRLGRKVGEVAGTVGMFAGPGVLHATRAATKSGASIQHEIVKMRAAGIPEDEIQKQVDVSADMAAKYPN